MSLHSLNALPRMKSMWPPGTRSSSNIKISGRVSKWGKRFFIAAVLLIAVHGAQRVYKNVPSYVDTNHGRLQYGIFFKFNFIIYYFSGEESPHFTRTLKSSGAAWESCDFENAHSPYAWLPLYISIILILFIGKSWCLIEFISITYIHDK